MRTDVSSGLLPAHHRLRHQSGGARMKRHADWVPETRFGTWFLGTRIWLRYVLADAFEDLRVLLDDRARQFRCIVDVGCGPGQALPLLETHFRPEMLLGLDVD